MAKNKVKKVSNRLSNTVVVLISIYPVSILLAATWQLSGWWLVAYMTISYTVLLLLAGYRDNRTINSVLMPLGITLALIGLRLATIGVGPMGTIQDDGYAVVGSLMALAGGVLIGLRLALRGSLNDKK